MYSIQEMVAHEQISENLKEIKRAMENYGCYNPANANPYMGLKRSVYRSLKESIRRTPLREFLSDTNLGNRGDYLVAAKLHDVMATAAMPYDITPLISSQMVYDFAGGTLTVDIPIHDSMRAKEYSGAGKIPDDGVSPLQATITTKNLGWNVAIANDLIEDSAFDLVEWHFRNAGIAFARRANELSLSVLLTGTDGDGTVNSGTSGDADETKFTSGTTTDIVTAIRKLGDDHFVPDTLICTAEAWGHSIMMHQGSAMMDKLPAPGFHNKISILDVLINNSDSLHASTDVPEAAFTNCISIIFDRKAALVTGRKRWLSINEYSNPVEDIGGAIIVGEQDSITAYDDSIYVLTET